jgi:Family of unknown function (DUF5681)
MTKRKAAAVYVVGFGRPPKATQFAPGESGNPKGRPKGSRTVGAVLDDILKQKIVVTENGRTRRLSTLEVMLRRLVNDALRSDPKAIRLLLALMERHGTASETGPRLDELTAEDRAILSSYLPGQAAASPNDKATRDGPPDD